LWNIHFIVLDRNILDRVPVLQNRDGCRRLGVVTDILVSTSFLNNSATGTAPESVESVAILPHLDRAVLGSCGVQVVIGRKRN
jgi:hypothetical protein